MKMRDKRKDLRPREKLKARGVESLSDFELLQAIIGSGNAQADVSAIAREVKKLLCEKGSELTYDDLLNVKSLGPAKATNIMANFELWKRQFDVGERPIIDSPEKAVEQLTDICDKKQEYFILLTLDGANRLIKKHIISIGTLTASLVHPREVFAEAIADRAASIIVAHNHPSGNIQPSDADIAITERLREASNIIGIALKNHIIVNSKRFCDIL